MYYRFQCGRRVFMLAGTKRIEKHRREAGAYDIMEVVLTLPATGVRAWGDHIIREEGVKF